MSDTLSDAFPGGVLRPELFLGVACSVMAKAVVVNLTEAGHASGSHYSGGRYGRGEVGEFVLIEGQQSLILGRIAEARLREPERRTLRRDVASDEAVGVVQLLGCVAMDTLRVMAGVDAYPRIGDRVYAAPHDFIAKFPELMEQPREVEAAIGLELGTVNGTATSTITVTPERLFGRHCAILGATGGGKSWTTARIIEQCLRHRSKVILIDATGEYRRFSGIKIVNCHLGDHDKLAEGSVESLLPPTSFQESDFIALFEPAGKVQGPKLRAAIRSLRLAGIEPSLAPNGYLKKIEQLKEPIESAENDPDVARVLDDPCQPFDVRKLVAQIEEECVYPDAFHKTIKGEKDTSKWGGPDGNFSHCLSLIGRINGALTSKAFESVFSDEDLPSLTDQIDEFCDGDDRLLRICFRSVAYEYSAREIIANTIGRHLLNKARMGGFGSQPVVAFLDEAHNFLGRRIGSEDYSAKLDAFELIAKEGRKYGLNICLASQRPRDITEGVLSQMGTLVVHRLTNDRDREVVERACGEIDRSASAFLPNLRQGEASIIGTDFPIPLTVQMSKPVCQPLSDGPSYQDRW